MPLTDGQVQVRDLVLGAGTAYELVSFNPWNRAVRPGQGEGRPWSHGAWSGAEFLDETPVPIRVYLEAPERTAAAWLPLQQALIAAFEPVGDTAAEVELRFNTGGTEFVMFGRPRGVQLPENELAQRRGKSVNTCLFAALDPRIYSGAEQTVQLGLPSFTGGLTVPVTAPFTVDGVMVGGKAAIVNDGLANTSLALRIDGPVVTPRVMLQRPDGLVQTLEVLFDLPAGQWLEIDTGSHSVLLNGVANRRGAVTGEFPILPPGAGTIRFASAEFDMDALLTVRWRHAW
jgi:hypothetical protein